MQESKQKAMKSNGASDSNFGQQCLGQKIVIKISKSMKNDQGQIHAHLDPSCNVVPRGSSKVLREIKKSRGIAR